MIQFLLAFTGFIAIYLTQQRNQQYKRYACIFGLLSQPFFLYETFNAGQWGMFVLSIFYTFAWVVGFYNNFISINFNSGETHVQ